MCTLPEVMTLVEEANNLRAAKQGVPIGLCLEIKPAPTLRMPVFSRISTIIMGAMVSGLESLGIAASESFYSATKTSYTLSSYLNRHIASGAQVPPMILFSSNGRAGEQDIQRFWELLSPQAKLAIADPLLQEPYQPMLEPLPAESRLHKILEAGVEFTKPFTVVGTSITGREPTKMITHLHPLDSRTALKAALSSHITIITTNRPDTAAHLWEQQQAQQRMQQEKSKQMFFL